MKPSTRNGKAKANGKHNGKALVSPRDMVAPAATRSYEPYDHRWFRRPRDLPPFTFLTIQAMLLDPTVRLGIAMREAPLMQTEWAYKQGETWVPGIRARKPEVGAFVLQTLEKIWQSIQAITRGQIWGWAAAEPVFCLKGGRVEFDTFMPRHANDVRCIKQGGEVVGVRFLRIKHAEQGHVDLAFPKAIWHAFEPEPGCDYGTSVLLGAYSPWADKWLDGGALDVRRLFMHKDSYGGTDLGYPRGTTEVEDKGAVPNRDIAREIAEQLTAGGITTRPSERDDKGNEMWPLTRAVVPANPQHILQFPKDLDLEILRGLEIADDVLTAEQSGAWNGKLVPLMAFYTGIDRWRASIINRCIVPQIIDYLVQINYGPQVYEVKAKPLALQAMEQQGASKSPGAQSQGGGPNDFPGGGDNGPPDHPGPIMPPNAGKQAMSLEEQVGRGIMDAAKVVKAARQITRMATGTAERTGEHWITIGGKSNEDGEHSGGFPVKLDGEGRIIAGGPKGLHGKHVSEAGEHFRDMRDAHKKAKYEQFTARDPIGQSRTWSKIAAYQGEKWGMSPKEYTTIAKEVHEQLSEFHQDRENAKKFIREALGKNAGVLSKIENSGRDFASVPGITSIGREAAKLYPGAALGPGYVQGQSSEHDPDYGRLAWDLVREGAKPAPSRFSREFHDKVEDYLEAQLRTHGSGGKKKAKAKEEDDFSFGANATAFSTIRRMGLPVAVEATAPEPSKFSSTQFDLPHDLATAMMEMAARINPNDLAGDGVEMQPHITVKYGLHTDETMEVYQAILGTAPVAVTLGVCSVFSPAGNDSQRGGDAYDVLKIEIESEALHELNAKISERLECTDTHPEYKPHATIAYVKPGLGEWYAAKLTDLAGKVAVFDRLTFSDHYRIHHSLPLTGKATRFSTVRRLGFGNGAHAPKGGVSIDGKEYKGGEFIPGKTQAEVDEHAEKQKPAAPRSDMDDSYDDWENNYVEVSNNPEKASSDNLRRALHYASHMRASHARNGRMNTADSFDRESDWYKQILRARESGEKDEPDAEPHTLTRADFHKQEKDKEGYDPQATNKAYWGHVREALESGKEVPEHVKEHFAEVMGGLPEVKKPEEQPFALTNKTEAQKPKFGDKGQEEQGALFGKKGLPGERNLFATPGTPDDMVYKPKVAKEPEFTGIRSGSRTETIAKELAARGQLAEKESGVWEGPGGLTGKTAGEVVRAYQQSHKVSTGRELATSNEQLTDLAKSVLNIQQQFPDHELTPAIKEKLATLKKFVEALDKPST